MSDFDKIHPALMIDALCKEGITMETLAKQLKRELKAKVNKAHYDKDLGEWVFSKGEIAWDVQQKARMDAQRLMGAYPAEQVHGDVTIEIIDSFGGKKTEPTEE